MPNRETMSGRERVVRTLRREPVDRMPIDLGMHPSSGISAFAYQRLREHLGLEPLPIRVHDSVQMLARVDEDVRARFHVDCCELEPPWLATRTWSPREPYRFEMAAAFNAERNESGEWRARQGERSMRMPAGGYFFDGDWLSNWGGLDEERGLALYAREAERLFKETDYATCFVGYCFGCGLTDFSGGIEQAVRMLTEPDAVKRDNEAVLQRNLRRAGRIIEAVGPYVQMIAMGNDMGIQSGPLSRPEVMEECVFPYYARFCEFIHKHSDIKVFMHNCGSIRAYIPALIEAGIDVLNPVQISAADMDPAELKAEFGDRIVFWGGGCDTQNVLGRATADEVGAHVGRLVETWKPGGGYVFNQVHNVVGNVPPENVVGMLDAAYEHSFYA
jgi:uroporphyrinogen decarboxylase